VNLALPELSLVVLIGPSGSGKSTFARAHFKPTEVLSSDFYRGVVSDDENNQAASKDAFETLHFIAARRLARGLLTVVDATNVQPEARKPLLELARRYHVFAVAVVFDLPEKLCQERNRARPDRSFGPHVVRSQRQALRRSLRDLHREGFREVYVLHAEEQVAAASIERTPLWPDRRWDAGPFDIVGDVHGCFDELAELLEKLGYKVGEGLTVMPPEGRKLVFLGDLVDRGPRVSDVLRLAMGMVEAGTAVCIPGNHDDKLRRALQGRQVNVSHGLRESLDQLGAEPPEFRERVAAFLDGLVSHYVLDEGRLVVAHAGMKEELQGRASKRVRDFALYGETTGETDEFGLPVRYNWAADYRGSARVVYGHTPVPEPEWLNRTINIDTGCVFGGRLTALRYPELALESVPARRIYFAPARPLHASTGIGGSGGRLTAQQESDDVLDLEDVTGRRHVETRLQKKITIREENAAAALEVMSRFAANPRWLIYLPPTMSPSETSSLPGLLEHPAEAFDYFRTRGVSRVVCEEKHMGSRSVVIVSRDEEAARRRFGVTGEGIGICYTRTGRRFFDDAALGAEFLDRVRAAVERAGLWEELATDWLCLDCELMPWSAKAQGLLTDQYAPVGAAARSALPEACEALARAEARGLDVGELRSRHADRLRMAEAYTEAYRRYCWEVRSLEDLKLAPFHLLASEGAVHTERDHEWHMRTLARLAGEDGLVIATPYRVLDPADEEARAQAVSWWEELTGRGGEGMVVKPLPFVARGERGLVQPALKCRGREYLRIIYGPEYDAPENLSRLRSRGLAGKRSLALREFALAMEALERFVRREPLRRVHECVFGVLALESEPVDPRL
jgi:protein phosphatase